MSAKKLLIAGLVATLLSACGGNPTSTPLPEDGTYTDPYGDLGTDSYSSDLSNVDPVTGLPLAGSTGDASTTSDGQIGDPTGAGFTLRGLVADALGAPLSGAKVSIGSQTILSNSTGEFEISGIRDSQVWVDVTKDGYESIKQFNITFTTTNPVADKEFKLATGGATSTTDGSSTNSTGTGSPTLSHEGTFGGPKWKSVSAFAVEGSKVYVLGVIDKTFWFDRGAVVVFNASTGEEMSRIGDKLFGKVPKAATSIQVKDGQITVSDGSTRSTFNAAGDFVKSASGGGFEASKIAIDEENSVTYSLKSGNKVVVDSSSFDGTLNLTDVGNAKAIHCDDSGNLLVLDDSLNTVHVFSLF